MIMVRVSQGLGNQMFQYAFGECLSKKLHMDVIYDASFISSKISGRTMRNINDIFMNSFTLASMEEVRRYSGRLIFRVPKLYDMLIKYEYFFSLLNSITWKFRRKKACKLIQEPEYWNIPEEFIDDILNIQLGQILNQNYYFNGFWESIRYIKDYRSFLQERFKFKIDKKRLERYISTINLCNSISIHIRRGDYITKTNDDIRFDICNEKYYEEAIARAKEMEQNPTFIVFSDDIVYAKELLKKESACIFVSGNKDYEDMYLMSLCRHNVIANSTFSFWGAFLNNNASQFVIAPKTQYIKRCNGEWKEILLPVLPEWEIIENYNGERI